MNTTAWRAGYVHILPRPPPKIYGELRQNPGRGASLVRGLSDSSERRKPP
jgi:hypothetical protein